MLALGRLQDGDGWLVGLILALERSQLGHGRLTETRADALMDGKLEDFKDGNLRSSSFEI